MATATAKPETKTMKKRRAPEVVAADGALKAASSALRLARANFAAGRLPGKSVIAACGALSTAVAEGD